MIEPPPPFLLDQLAGISSYFALGADRIGPGWVPVSTVITDTVEDGNGGRPGVLEQAIDNVASRLHTNHRWVAASILYQGWAARLTSIYSGSITLGGAIPDLAAANLSYRLGPPGPSSSRRPPWWRAMPSADGAA